jgi:hypothetical protein
MDSWWRSSWGACARSGSIRPMFGYAW